MKKFLCTHPLNHMFKNNIFFTFSQPLVSLCSHPRICLFVSKVSEAMTLFPISSYFMQVLQSIGYHWVINRIWDYVKFFTVLKFIHSLLKKYLISFWVQAAKVTCCMQVFITNAVWTYWETGREVLNFFIMVSLLRLVLIPHSFILNVNY